MKSTFSSLLGLLVFILLSGCDSTDTLGPVNGTTPDTTTWLALGPDGLQVDRLRLFEPYLYALARSQGIWRKDVTVQDSLWEFLGLDSTLAPQGRFSRPTDLVAHETHPDWLLATHSSDDIRNHSLYRSFDGGKTWQPTDSTLALNSVDEREFWQVRSLLRLSDRILDDGYFESFDFGETWSPFLDAPLVDADVAVQHPSNPRLIWMGGAQATFDPSLSYSSDGGQTWVLLNDTVVEVASQQAVLDIALVPGDEDAAYVGLMGVLIKTLDRGQSWEILDT